MALQTESRRLTTASGPGLTIIPVATPLTSLNYFDGKFLRAEDLRLEQAYGRTLVALTARGAGSGVVHGFELELSGGDGLRLHGGLAVSASGGVIELPSDAALSITELITRSEPGSISPGALPPGRSLFAPCEPVAPAGPDLVLGQQVVYLITVAAEAALCGEEERFDQLCADACLTETDRPRRVEGVRVRARRLSLGALPASSAVTFTGTHLRSQVATAYFAAERLAVPDRISASGLVSSIWCDGAAATTADEVPIGLLARDGDVASFCDLWSARREMIEPPAQRYWAWRLAMRPWDAFLAQLLQFQCQLSDLPGTAPTGLVAAGFVTLPPAGYLPLDLAQPVVAQLRDRFGPGVDLRFGVAPADHVPEILRQAQDLDRISLTAGLDDPEAVEPVDVIVPDGRLETAPGTTIPTYTGTVRLPQERPTLFSTVARDLSAGNVVWAGAGHAELSDDPDPGPRFRRLFRGPARADPAQPAAPPAEPIPLLDPGLVFRRSDLALLLNRDRILARDRRQRITAAAAGGFERPVFEPALPLAADRSSTLDVWLDLSIDTPLHQAQRGDRARMQGLLAAYQRRTGDRRDSAIEHRADGELTVIDRVDMAGQFGRPASSVITTGLVGTIQIGEFRVDPADDTFEVFRIVGRLAWTFVHETDRPRLIAVSELVVTRSDSDESNQVALTFTAALNAMLLSGDLTHHATGLQTHRRDDLLLDFQLARDDHALDPGRVERDLAGAVIESIGAELSLPSRDPDFVRRATRLLLGQADPGGPIEVTAVRDWVLFTRRREVRFPGDIAVAPLTTRSYVAYHAVIDNLEQLSQFLPLIDRLARSVDELVPDSDLAASTRRILRERTVLPFVRLRSPLDAIGFERVGVVEFVPGGAGLATPIERVRNAFAAQPRGDRLVWQAAGDIGAGDGEQVLEARLAGYRGAIASLIDTSTPIAPQLLSDVPDDFVSPGIDGVLFTVGLAQPQRIGRQFVFALEETQVRDLGIAVEEHGGWENTTLTELQQDTPLLDLSVVARFGDAGLINGNEVQRWWDSVSIDPPIQAVLQPSRSAAEADGGVAERDRAAVLVGKMPLPQIAEPPEDTEGFSSLVILVRTDPNPEDTAEQVLVSMTASTMAKLDQTAESLGGYGRMTRDQVQLLLADLPSIVASYDDGLTNPNEVETWWSATSDRAPAGIVLHAGAEVALRTERERAVALRELLKAPDPPELASRIGDALGHQSVVYLLQS